MSAAEGAYWLASLALERPEPTDETVRPGWLGLGVFLLLVLATVLLIRSMNKHLRKVPRTFDGTSAGRDEAGLPPDERGTAP